MPKPRKSKCSDCFKLRESWFHKCIRHSVQCVDSGTGLWDPSVCSDCAALFARALDRDAEARDVLKQMALQIRAKAIRKGTQSETIFASEELRRKFDSGFFRRAILLRDRSKSREPMLPQGDENLLEINEPSGSGLQPVSVNPPGLSTPNPSVLVQPSLEHSPVSASGSDAGRDMDNLLVELGISPSLAENSSDAQYFSGFQDSPNSSAHSCASEGIHSFEDIPEPFEHSSPGIVPLDNPNLVQPVGSNPLSQGNDQVLSRIEASLADLVKVISTEREESQTRWATLSQQRLGYEAVGSMPPPHDFSNDIMVRRVDPSNQAPPFPSMDAHEDNVDFNQDDVSNFGPLDNQNGLDSDSEFGEEPGLEIWPGFQGRTNLSPEKAELLLCADPQPVRYLLSRPDQLQFISWDGWISPYGKFSSDEVYIASDDSQRTFVVFMGDKSARTYRAESDLKHFDSSVGPKSINTNLKRAPRVFRTFADYAPTVPGQWSVPNDESTICVNGSNETLEELFNLLDVKDKPQNLDWKLTSDSEKGNLFLDFIQGDKLKEDCHAVEGVFQKGFTVPLFPQRRGEDFKLREKVKRELFGLTGLELVKRTLEEASKEDGAISPAVAVVSLAPLVDLVEKAIRPTVFQSAGLAKSHRLNSRKISSANLQGDPQVRETLLSTVISGPSLFEPSSIEKVTKLLAQSEQRKIKLASTFKRKAPQEPVQAKVPKLLEPQQPFRNPQTASNFRYQSSSNFQQMPGRGGRAGSRPFINNPSFGQRGSHRLRGQERGTFRGRGPAIGNYRGSSKGAPRGAQGGPQRGVHQLQGGFRGNRGAGSFAKGSEHPTQH